MAESNIRGASLDGILERLSNAPEYHPLEAETFADWSMEAGDIVTLSRGGRNYHSPIHESTVNWRKHQQVTVSSKGTQERKSISKLSQQRYNRGGGGARRNDYWSMVVSDATGKLQAGIELTYSSARMWVDNANELMHSELALTASTARLWVENAKAGLKSELAMTASTAKLWVESLYDQMESGLDITLSSAKLYTQNRTTRAYIMTRINANGEGEALIDASKVRISGDTTVNDIMGIFDRNVQIRVPLGVNGGVTANSLTLRLGGDQATISAAKLNKAIVEASVSGNTLTLTSLDGTKTNFSKAVGYFTVGAGGGRVNVTAWPQNQTKRVPVSIGGTRSISSNGDYTYRVYAENDDGDDIDTGASISVNVAVPSETHSIGIDGTSKYDGSSTWWANRTQIFTSMTLTAGNTYGFRVKCGSAYKYYGFKIAS